MISRIIVIITLLLLLLFASSTCLCISIFPTTILDTANSPILRISGAPLPSAIQNLLLIDTISLRKRSCTKIFSTVSSSDLLCQLSSTWDITTPLTPVELSRLTASNTEFLSDRFLFILELADDQNGFLYFPLPVIIDNSLLLPQLAGNTNFTESSPGSVLILNGTNLNISSSISTKTENHYRFISLSAASSQGNYFEADLIRGTPDFTHVIIVVPSDIVAGVYKVEICLGSSGCTTEPIVVYIPLKFSLLQIATDLIRRSSFSSRLVSISWSSDGKDLLVLGQNFPSTKENNLNLELTTIQKSSIVFSLVVSDSSTAVVNESVATLTENLFTNENASNAILTFSSILDSAFVSAFSPILSSAAAFPYSFSFNPGTNIFTLTTSSTIPTTQNVTFLSARMNQNITNVDVIVEHDNNFIVTVTGNGFTTATQIEFCNNSSCFRRCDLTLWISSESLKCVVIPTQEIENATFEVRLVFPNEISGSFFSMSDPVFVSFPGLLASTSNTSSLVSSPTSNNTRQHNNNNKIFSIEYLYESNTIQMTGFFIDKIEFVLLSESLFCNITSFTFDVLICRPQQQLPAGVYSPIFTTTTNETRMEFPETLLHVPLHVTSILPSVGSFGGNQLITIFGENFNLKATTRIFLTAFRTECIVVDLINETTLTCQTESVDETKKSSVENHLILQYPTSVTISDSQLSQILFGISPSSCSSEQEVVTNRNKNNKIQVFEFANLNFSFSHTVTPVISNIEIQNYPNDNVTFIVDFIPTTTLTISSELSFWIYENGNQSVRIQLSNVTQISSFQISATMYHHYSPSSFATEIPLIVNPRLLVLTNFGAATFTQQVQDSFFISPSSDIYKEYFGLVVLLSASSTSSFVAGLGGGETLTITGKRFGSFSQQRKAIFICGQECPIFEESSRTVTNLNGTAQATTLLCKVPPHPSVEKSRFDPVSFRENYKLMYSSSSDETTSTSISNLNATPFNISSQYYSTSTTFFTCPVEIVVETSSRSTPTLSSFNSANLDFEKLQVTYPVSATYSAPTFNSVSVVVTKIDPSLISLTNLGSSSTLTNPRRLTIFGSGFGNVAQNVEVKLFATSTSLWVDCIPVVVQFTFLSCDLHFNSSTNSNPLLTSASSKFSQLSLKVNNKSAIVEHATSRLLTANLNMPDYSVSFAGNSARKNHEAAKNNNILFIQKGETVLLDASISQKKYYSAIVVKGGKLVLLPPSSSTLSTQQKSRRMLISLSTSYLIIEDEGQFVVGSEDRPVDGINVKFRLNLVSPSPESFETVSSFLKDINSTVVVSMISATTTEPALIVSNSGIVSMIATNEDQTTESGFSGSILAQTRFFHYPNPILTASCNVSAYLAADALANETSLILNGIWKWPTGRKLFVGYSSSSSSSSQKWCSSNHEIVRIAAISTNSTHTLITTTNPLQCDHRIARASSSSYFSSLGPPVFDASFLLPTSQTDLNDKITVTGGKILIMMQNENAQKETALQLLNVRLIGTKILVNHSTCRVKIERCKFAETTAVTNSSLLKIASAAYVFAWGNLFVSLFSSTTNSALVSILESKQTSSSAVVTLQCNLVVGSKNSFYGNSSCFAVSQTAVQISLLDNFAFHCSGHGFLIQNSSSIVSFLRNKAFRNGMSGVFAKEQTSFIIDSLASRFNDGETNLKLSTGVSVQNSIIGNSGVEYFSTSLEHSEQTQIVSTIFVVEEESADKNYAIRFSCTQQAFSFKISGCSFINFVNSSSSFVVALVIHSLTSSSSLIDTDSLRFLNSPSRILFVNQSSDRYYYPMIVDQDETLFSGTSASSFVVSPPLTLLASRSVNPNVFFNVSASASCTSARISASTWFMFSSASSSSFIMTTDLPANDMMICGGGLSFIPIRVSFNSSSSSSISVTIKTITASTSLLSFNELLTAIFFVPTGINTRAIDLIREPASEYQNLTFSLSAVSSRQVEGVSVKILKNPLFSFTSEQYLRIGFQQQYSSENDEPLLYMTKLIKNTSFYRYFADQQLPLSSSSSSSNSAAYLIVNRSAPFTSTAVLPVSSAFTEYQLVFESFSASSSSTTISCIAPLSPALKLFYNETSASPISTTSWEDYRNWIYTTSDGKVPQKQQLGNGQEVDVRIPRGVTITINLENYATSSTSSTITKKLGYYRSLIIEGTLIIQELSPSAATSSGVTLIIESSFLLVIGGGQLIVTNNNLDGKRKILFNIIKTPSSSRFCLTKSLSIKPGTFFVSTSSGALVQMQGATPTTISSKLRETVSPSAITTTTTTLFNLQNDLTGWNHGNEVIVASTSFDSNEAEIVTVDTISSSPSSSGNIIPGSDGSFLTSTWIRHEHLSIDQLASSKPFSAEVGLLTRNIEISSAAEIKIGDENDLLQIIVSPSAFSPILFSGVSFKNCDLISVTSGSSQKNSNNNNVMRSLSFSRSVFRSLGEFNISSSMFYLLVSESIFDSLCGSFSILSSSQNILLQNNLVFGTIYTTATTNSNAKHVCSILVQKDCRNVSLRQNTIAGSQGFGFCLDSSSFCSSSSSSLNLTTSSVSNPDQSFSIDSNTVHSSVVGFVFLLTACSTTTTTSDFVVVSKSNLWHNSYSGILAITISSTKNFWIIDSVLHDNLNAIELQGLLPNNNINILRNQISGRTPFLASSKSCDNYYTNFISRKPGNEIRLPSSTTSSAILIGPVTTKLFKNLLWSSVKEILNNFVKPHFGIVFVNDSATSSSEQNTTISLLHNIFSDFGETFPFSTSQNIACSQSRILSFSSLQTENPSMPFVLTTNCSLNSTTTSSSNNTTQKNFLLGFNSPSPSSFAAMLTDTDGIFLSCSSPPCFAFASPSTPQLLPSAWDKALPSATFCERFSSWGSVGGLVCDSRSDFGTLHFHLSENDEHEEEKQVWMRSDSVLKQIPVSSSSAILALVGHTYTMEFRNSGQYNRTVYFPSSTGSKIILSLPKTIITTPSKTLTININLPPLWKYMSPTFAISTFDLMSSSSLLSTCEVKSTGSSSLQISIASDQRVEISLLSQTSNNSNINLTSFNNIKARTEFRTQPSKSYLEMPLWVILVLVLIGLVCLLIIFFMTRMAYKDLMEEGDSSNKTKSTGKETTMTKQTASDDEEGAEQTIRKGLETKTLTQIAHEKQMEKERRKMLEEEEMRNLKVASPTNRSANGEHNEFGPYYQTNINDEGGDDDEDDEVHFLALFDEANNNGFHQGGFGHHHHQHQPKVTTTAATGTMMAGGLGTIRPMVFDAYREAMEDDEEDDTTAAGRFGATNMNNYSTYAYGASNTNNNSVFMQNDESTGMMSARQPRAIRTGSLIQHHQQQHPITSQSLGNMLPNPTRAKSFGTI